MPSLADFRTDVLILLVGKNPLPVAVSAIALYDAVKLYDESKKTARILLAHTGDGGGTWPETRNIRDFLEAKLKCQLIEPVEIDDTNGVEIHRCLSKGVRDYFECPEIGSVGLNYTGGTSAMGFYAYRSLETTAEEMAKNRADRRLVYSYLDARTYGLHFSVKTPGERTIRHHGPISLLQDSRDPSFVGVSEKLRFSFEDIATRLQGWDILPKDDRRLRGQPLTSPQPNLPRTCAELLKLASCGPKSEGYQLLTEWTARLQNSSDGTLDLPEEFASLLSALQADLPGLSNTPTLREISNHENFQFDAGKNAKNFFRNAWIENAVLHTLQKMKRSDGSPVFHDSYRNVYLEAGREKIELDCVAVRDYETVFFECTLFDKRGSLKETLFEVYHRSSRIGGGEARAALVCPAWPARAEDLEHEIQSDIGTTNRFKIFGLREWRDFEGALRTWLDID